MKCNNCGTNCSDDASFCSKCGYPFKHETEEAIENNETIRWYLYNGEETFGPISESEVSKYMSSDSNLVWREGLENWLQYKDSELMNKKAEISLPTKRNRVLLILAYVSILIIALLTFAPMYSYVDSYSLKSISYVYRMIDDIAYITLPCLAFIAIALGIKKYFASFWLTLILGLIMYLRLILIPSTDFNFDYYGVNSGIFLVLTVIVYLTLFISIAILFAKKQKLGVKERYKN